MNVDFSQNAISDGGRLGEARDPFSLHTGLLIALLYKYCTGSHSCSELLSAVAPSCPEDTVSLKFSFLLLPPLPQRCLSCRLQNRDTEKSP